jgi:hypothetical protein
MIEAAPPVEVDAEIPPAILSEKPTADLYTSSNEALSPSQVRTFMDCQMRWWFESPKFLGDLLDDVGNKIRDVGVGLHLIDNDCIRMSGGIPLPESRVHDVVDVLVHFFRYQAYPTNSPPWFALSVSIRVHP